MCIAEGKMISGFCTCTLLYFTLRQLFSSNVSPPGVSPLREAGSAHAQQPAGTHHARTGSGTAHCQSMALSRVHLGSATHKSITSPPLPIQALAPPASDDTAAAPPPAARMGLAQRVIQTVGSLLGINARTHVLQRSARRIYDACTEPVRPGAQQPAARQVGILHAIDPFLSLFFQTLHPHLYRVCGLPDTFQSWFLIAQLHVWMSLVRLKAEVGDLRVGVCWRWG